MTYRAEDWKPGDVAIRTALGGGEMLSLFVSCARTEHSRRPHWHHQDGGWDPDVSDSLSRYRRLVVMDPEDNDWIKGTAPWIDWIEDQYRTQTQPPKPHEPTGLGSVVRDAGGRQWTRYDTKGDPQPWWCDDAGPKVPIERRFSYADIDAVAVLSQGVTPDA